ncbi:class I SAM-dependent methyltransferase [Herbaspirillum sp.]|uniref:class I SAM-dependent methyltransferase n=1 Tax=Herbaspirillum sp. TaxID=1890675 RepID=UPI0031D53B37
MSRIGRVICDGDEWDRIGAVYAGQTRLEGQVLQRVEREFPLGSCRNCGHVRTLVDYDVSVFSMLYAQDSQQPVSWGETGSADVLLPYVEMIEIAGGAGLKHSAGRIVDVGCGNGPLLVALAERFDIPVQRLLGIDFNRMLPDRFSFVQADLNSSDLMELVGDEMRIDAVMSSHVIEHVLDPRRFLRQLKKLVQRSGGVIYIETPDFSAIDVSRPDVCNLLHPQHINYFTADSLGNLMRSVGLVVDHVDTHVTGGIPRLRMCAHPVGVSAPAAQLQASLDAGVDTRNRIARALLSGGPALLWGAGGDLWRLLQEHPELEPLLAAGTVCIADRALAGAVMYGQSIQSSSDIRHWAGPVWVMPAYSGTRRSMINFALAEGFDARLVDLYAQ